MDENNKLQAKPQKMTFSAAINSTGYQKLLNNTLKDPADVKRFVSSLTSAVAINPALQECVPSTILSAALLGNSLGLSPSPQLGQYYMVPYDVTLKDEKGRDVYLTNPDGSRLMETWSDGSLHPVKAKEKRAQFQLGYKGYIQLALRSGYYKRLNVMAVKPGELKKYDPFLEEIELELMDDEIAREKAKSIGYVAMFEYMNGFRKILYWSREKMEAHALRFSRGYAAKKGYTFWEKDFDAMAFKTMLRQLISKWGIMSIDLQTAFEEDHIVMEDGEQYLETAEPQLTPPADVPQLEEETAAGDPAEATQVSLADI